MRDVDNHNVTAEVLEDMVDEQRIVSNWQHIGIKRSPKRFIPSRQLLAFAVGLALVGAGIWASVALFSDSAHAPTPLSFELSESTRMFAVPSKAIAERRIPLSDGSSITLAPGASLEVKDNEPKLFRTSLHKGWVRYNVIPSQARTWEVNVGLCRVIVLGTQFTVNRTTDSVHVAGHRGSVAVYHPTEEQIFATVVAGKSFVLNTPKQDELKAMPTRPTVADATQNQQAEERAFKERPAKRKVLRSSSATRPRAHARQSLPKLAGLGASEEVNQLLKRADEAREKNRPQRAVSVLEQILHEHPHDPAVGLVALTIGKIRLDTLHQPSAAARAFKKAALSKRLPLALREQAFGRCVEAYHHAGDIPAARAMGKKYKHRFPNGTWLSLIERWTKTE